MKIILLVIVAIISMAGSAGAIEFWHSGTVWANDGMCEARFSFDAGALSETIQQLRIDVTIRNKTGKAIGYDALEIDEFGGSEANRYASASLVSKDMCHDGLTIFISKASAVINDNKVDLLKIKQLFIRDFKPYKIVIPIYTDKR